MKAQTLFALTAAMTALAPIGAASAAASASFSSPTYPKIRFNFSAAALKATCAKAIATADAHVERLAKASDASRTFANTVARFEDIRHQLDQQTSGLQFLSQVSSSLPVQDAANACTNDVNNFLTKVFARPDLYHAMDVVNSKGLKLDLEDAKLLLETIRNFTRSGANLADEPRKKVIDLNQQLTALQTEFSANYARANDTVELTHDDLAGMSDDFISTLKPSGKGTFLLTVLNDSEFLPYMQNAKSGSARKRVQTGHDTAAAPRNVKLLEQAIAIRDQLGKLLGFPTWAAYQLDAKMAKTPERVLDFLNDLSTRLAPKVESDLAVLLALKQKEEPDATKVELWDWRYYDNQLKKSHAVDNEAIRAYFPVDHVITTVFEIYQTMLSVKFTEISPAKAWAPDVRLFEIRDARAGKEGDLIGHFYLDLYPRANKYKHFAAFDIIHPRREKDGSYHKPISAIVGNFPKAAPGKPALLLHDDVTTFFHEFGHIMHQTLTEARYASLAGTNVRNDFVEAPSQMLENWTWDAAEIKKISSNYKDQSPLPDALIKNLVDAQHLDEGIYWSRQLFFSTFDMTIHSSGPTVDTTRVWNELSPKIYHMDVVPGNAAQASFGHLMGGYDAGYYGYLWSKVYAQDMFTVFQAAGLESPIAGGHYRDWILEKGGTMEPDVLIMNFLGREPNKDAFYRSLGIGDTH